jgi:hypothetical protein
MLQKFHIVLSVNGFIGEIEHIGFESYDWRSALPTNAKILRLTITPKIKFKFK